MFQSVSFIFHDTHCSLADTLSVRILNWPRTDLNPPITEAKTQTLWCSSQHTIINESHVKDLFYINLITGLNEVNNLRE